MTFSSSKLLTIFTEAALEKTLIRDIERLGATGYTISDVRGKGSRGLRDAVWEPVASIRIEIICDEKLAGTIIAYFQEHYYANFAMAMFTVDVLFYPSISLNVL
jgi:hypothetical protein